jgi:hypothetical protein
MSLRYRLVEVEYDNKPTRYYIQWFKEDKLKSFFGRSPKGTWCNVFGETYTDKDAAQEGFKHYIDRNEEPVISNITVLGCNF